MIENAHKRLASVESSQMMSPFQTPKISINEEEEEEEKEEEEYCRDTSP
jgi:hypothetical protein